MDNNYDLVIEDIPYSFECLWEFDGFLLGVDQDQKAILYWNNYTDKHTEYSLITLPDKELLDLYLSNKLESSKLFLIDNIKQIGVVFHTGEVIPTEFKAAIPHKGVTLGYNFFIANVS